MSKKLYPLIVVLVLLAAYATYRAVDARAGLAGASESSTLTNPSAGDVASGEVVIPDTGAVGSSWTNLSTSDVRRGRSTLVTEYTNRWRR